MRHIKGNMLTLIRLARVPLPEACVQEGAMAASDSSGVALRRNQGRHGHL